MRTTGVLARVTHAHAPMREDGRALPRHTHLSDEALVALVARGDESALGELYDRVGRSRTASPDPAEPSGSAEDEAWLGFERNRVQAAIRRGHGLGRRRSVGADE